MKGSDGTLGSCDCGAACDESEKHNACSIPPPQPGPTREVNGMKTSKVLLVMSFLVAVVGWLFDFKSGSNAGLVGLVVLVILQELVLLERGPQIPFQGFRIAVCVFVSVLFAALNSGIVPRGTPRLITILTICGSAVGVCVLKLVLVLRRKASSGVVAQ
jgi:hypothetical protein